MPDKNIEDMSAEEAWKIWNEGEPVEVVPLTHRFWRATTEVTTRNPAGEYSKCHMRQ